MSSISTACANARTIKWLGRQSPEMAGLLRESYAKHLSIPVSQTCETFTSNEELAWVYQAFAREIDELSNPGSRAIGAAATILHRGALSS